MSAKFTKGPFYADNNADEIPYRIVSKTTQGNVGYAYCEADADLFAAAPDMYEALQEFVEAYKDHPQRLGAGSKAMTHFTKARTAIAKANGSKVQP